VWKFLQIWRIFEVGIAETHKMTKYDVKMSINQNYINRFLKFKTIYGEKKVVLIVLKFWGSKLKIKGFMKEQLLKLINSKI